MKLKYIIVSITMLFSLFVLSYFIFMWNSTYKLTTKYSEIYSLSFELRLVNEKQIGALHTLLEVDNFDSVTHLIFDFNQKLEHFIKKLKDTQDESLITLANQLYEKNKKLNFIYEDLKTDTAEIKNSIKWLSTTYKEYLRDMSDHKVITKDLLEYIFDSIVISNSNSPKEIKQLKIESSDKTIQRLKVHLNVLYIEHRDLVYSLNALNTYDINAELESINRYVTSRITHFKSETSTIVVSLLVSTILFMIIGLIVYIREVINNLNIAKLKNELQRFVDALNESAIVSKSDINGIITYVNDKFCQVSGYKREELLGKAHSILRHEDMKKEVFANLWNTIKSKKVFRATIKNKARSGEAYFVDSVVIPMLDIDNNIIEYMAVRYDVTEIIESRDRAILAEKAKGEFLSNMSHELRTPLNAIQGFSHILKRKIEDEKHSSYIQNIIDSSEHLIGLINDILDLSKLQSGKFSLDYHDFNLYEKMNLFLVRFDAQIDIADLRMNIDIDDSLKSTFNGDWLRITQIITNLISNAIKFTPKGKKINLSAKYENFNLIIVVKDDGIGMSEEAQAKIFKPFEQADTSTTRKYGGTGLGLSIVLNLIEQMKGDIKLTSSEGKGSEFEIVIPLVKLEKRDYEVDTIEEEEAQTELKGHLLIAEDNKTNQMLIGLLIDELGLTYEIVNDGVEAVERFDKDKFDLVLMDENMPNMNGTEAMKQIHAEHGNEIPIVALTANVMSGDKEKFIESGMAGYISKPIDEQELYKVLKSFLKPKK